MQLIPIWKMIDCSNRGPGRHHYECPHLPQCHWTNSIVYCENFWCYRRQCVMELLRLYLHSDPTPSSRRLFLILIVRTLIPNVMWSLGRLLRYHWYKPHRQQQQRPIPSKQHHHAQLVEHYYSGLDGGQTANHLYAYVVVLYSFGTKALAVISTNLNWPAKGKGNSQSGGEKRRIGKKSGLSKMYNHSLATFRKSKTV